MPGVQRLSDVETASDAIKARESTKGSKDSMSVRLKRSLLAQEKKKDYPTLSEIFEAPSQLMAVTTGSSVASVMVDASGASGGAAYPKGTGSLPFHATH